MQEIQLHLVQLQVVMAELAFHLMALMGLGLAWLLALTGTTGATRLFWQRLFGVAARFTMLLGLLWLTVMATALPLLLERTGNVLGPMIGGVVALAVLTEALAWRMTKSPHAGLSRIARWLAALGYSAALAVVLLADSWMRTPVGAALIDGRYQVTEWSAIVGASEFVRGLLASAFGALILLAAIAAWSAGALGQRESDAHLDQMTRLKRRLAGLGVAGLLGLLWLLTQAVGGQLGPNTQSAQTLSDALLVGSGNWSLRITFVLWLVTLAGLVATLGPSGGDGRIGAIARRVPFVTAPLLCCFAWWELFVKSQQSLVSGLPLTDLASMQPAWALVLGLLLVCALVLLCIGLLTRLVVRGDLGFESRRGGQA